MFNIFPAYAPFSAGRTPFSARRNILHRSRHRSWQYPPIGPSPIDYMWTPRSRNDVDHELPALFGGLGVVTLPASSSFSYAGPYSNYPDDTHLRELDPDLPKPFDRAAMALNYSLDAAVKFCKDVEKQFDNETSGIAVWADPQSVEDLWSMKLAWNGVPISEHPQNRDIMPASTVITYNMMVKDLYDAMEELRMAAVPNLAGVRDLDCAQQSPERIRTTLRKLNVTFDGIDELIESVRTHRERISALQKELSSAQNLLRGIRDLWMQQPRRADRGQRSAD